MSIPTQKAGPKGWATKDVQQEGRNPTEVRGYSVGEMPPPEHARRWERLANTIVPHSRIPDGARK